MLQIRKLLFFPNFSPGHVRIPAEKDNIPSTWRCLSSFKKRSGRKVNGSTQYSMSWWIAQRLTNTVTSRRMKKPATVVSRGVGWGIAWGVSLTMRTISVKNASKQGKFGLSDNSGNRSAPTTLSNSRCNLACVSGYYMAENRLQRISVEVVIGHLH